MDKATRPIRVAVIGPRSFPEMKGGVEYHCEQLYPRLVKLGCEVCVYARRVYGVHENKMYHGVHFTELLCPKNKFLEPFVYAFRALIAARKFTPTIIHFHSIGPSLFAPLARLMGYKVVMTHHGPDFEKNKWPGPAKLVLRLGELLGCTMADQVIATSKDIGEKLNVVFRRIVPVIPSGIDIPEIVTGEETLKKFGLEKGKYILAVGELTHEKGFGDLMQGFNIANIRDWKLVIVGRTGRQDAYNEELEETAQDSKNVVMTGFLTEDVLTELYSHAGLFALPSYYEALPTTFLKALSYGLSCIVSNIPANREVELASDRYFEPGDTNGISRKIIAFISKPLSVEEKEKQRSMISTRYNWDAIAAKTIEVYKSVNK